MNIGQVLVTTVFGNVNQFTDYCTQRRDLRSSEGAAREAGGRGGARQVACAQVPHVRTQEELSQRAQVGALEAERAAAHDAPPGAQTK